MIENKNEEKTPKEEKSISIDFGMKNLMTIYNPSGNQYIIKGNYIISMNSYYNNEIDNCRSIISKIENGEKIEEINY